MEQSEFPREALSHAWNWFTLHAGQRMQSFHFFLIVTAFLVAGYASVVDKDPHVAAGIGALGAWVSFWFNRLERRTKQLVKAGEAAIIPLQQLLADLTKIPTINILNAVEQKVPGSSSYSVVIDAIQETALVAFTVGALYALR